MLLIEKRVVDRVILFHDRLVIPVRKLIKFRLLSVAKVKGALPLIFIRLGLQIFEHSLQGLSQLRRLSPLAIEVVFAE